MPALREPLVKFTRVVINVDVRLENKQATLVFLQDAGPDEERPGEHEDVSFLDLLLHFTITGKVGRRPRAKARVLKFFPKYWSAISGQMEDFCRVKLVLHNPFRQGHCLAQACTRKPGYTSCSQRHNHIRSSRKSRCP